jgi:hypothetical protein
MDMLFAHSKPWAWEAEANFKLLKEQNPDEVRSTALGRKHSSIVDEEAKGAFHIDQVSDESK